MDPRLEQLQRSLESVVHGMTSEQMSWHPPGKWSASEVLEHLYLTYTGTIKGFERVLASGSPLATTPSLAHRVLTFIVVRLRHIPSGRKTPEVARPRGLPAEEVRRDIGAQLLAMDAVIAKCEARFGGRVKVLDHPILGPLTAPEWRTLHAVHGRHHHKQLLRLRENATAAGR